MRALVVGAGVSGLSCALRLAEAGVEVVVRAREVSPNTTSDVAAAIWHPFRVGPEGAVARWGHATREVFERLARDPATGVVLRDGVEVSRTPEDAAAPWREGLAGARRRAEPPAGARSASELRVPIVEMGRYLPWLQGRVLDRGVRIERGEVGSLDDCAADADVVVCCAGLGARALASDESLVPVRGQVVRVAGGDLERFLIDNDNEAGVTYVIPRSGDCVLGGTVDEGSWDLEPSADTTAAILARCTAAVPELAGREVLSVAVGLRPGRESVRLAVERLAAGTPVVHDYGHGGAGVTLSWGCADEVRRLCLDL